MQRIAFATATAALLALGLTGCFSGTPTSAESPLPSSRPSATASTSATPRATPTATPSQTATAEPAPDPQPTEDAGQSNPNPGTGDAAPAKWSDDELVGACKEEWTQSGGVSDWSDYSPDARIDQRGSGYYVAIPAESSGDVRDCTITGSPTESSVVLGG